MLANIPGNNSSESGERSINQMLQDQLSGVKKVSRQHKRTNTNSTNNHLLGAEQTILEVEDEREEMDSINTRSTLALIERIQGDGDLKRKLEKVIHILSSIKNDFN
jgi:hypothetical protein